MGFKAAWRALVHGQDPTREAAAVAPGQGVLQPIHSLDDLAAAVNSLHRELAQLRLEWAETLDKMTAWANRQAARDRIRLKATPLAGEDEPDQVPAAQHSLPFTAPAPEGNGTPSGLRHPKADLYARIQRR